MMVCLHYNAQSHLWLSFTVVPMRKNILACVLFHSECFLPPPFRQYILTPHLQNVWCYIERLYYVKNHGTRTDYIYMICTWEIKIKCAHSTLAGLEINHNVLDWLWELAQLVNWLLIKLKTGQKDCKRLTNGTLQMRRLC